MQEVSVKWTKLDNVKVPSNMKMQQQNHQRQQQQQQKQ
jgi:hypothetical protein